MEAVIAVGLMVAVWIIVLWGSIHFNNNVQ